MQALRWRGRRGSSSTASPCVTSAKRHGRRWSSRGSARPSADPAPQRRCRAVGREPYPAPAERISLHAKAEGTRLDLPLRKHSPYLLPEHQPWTTFSRGKVTGSSTSRAARFQHVAGTPDGVQQIDLERSIQLGPQSANGDIHHIGVTFKRIFPDLFAQLCAIQDDTTSSRQQGQQFELLRCQRKQPSLPKRLPSNQIKFEVGNLHLVGQAVCCRLPPTQGMHPRKQL